MFANSSDNVLTDMYMFIYGRKAPEKPTPLRHDKRKHVDTKRSKINTGSR